MTETTFDDWPEPEPEDDGPALRAADAAPHAYTFATWLAAALRTDPFVAARLVEYDGWQTRGRPSSTGPFDPGGVLEHHTACMLPAGHDGASCVRGIVAGSSSLPGPISQLVVCNRYGSRGPTVVVAAAGRANHGNGSNVAIGVPWAGGSRDWNAYTIGIEVCGPPPVGQLWPVELVELRARVTAALLRYWRVGVDRVYTHATNNPSNKVDPSGPWVLEPALAQLRPWNLATWRGYVAPFVTLAPPPVDPSPPEESPVSSLASPMLLTVDLEPAGGYPGTVFLASPDYQTVRWVQTGRELELLTASFAARGWPATPVPVPADDLGQYGVLIGPVPKGYPEQLLEGPPPWAVARG